LSLEISEASYVNISLYNQNGIRVEELFDGYRNEKQIQLSWRDKQKLKPGNYYLRFNIGGKILGKKLIKL
jgi:hypothetical protein